jgi:hypothetical protein
MDTDDLGDRVPMIFGIVKKCGESATEQSRSSVAEGIQYRVKVQKLAQP